MNWAPHVTVATVVEADGRYLFVEERTDEGVRFNQPAGHLEPGESLVEAAIRETLEETAHRVVPEHLIGVYRWSRDGGTTTFLRFAFAARAVDEDPGRPLDEGIVRAVWMTPDEIRLLAARHRSPLVMRCLEDCLAGRRFPLDALQDMQSWNA
ncbi:MAG: NUDIX domain-containing protein [Betaproteobacteria bacterium]|nr:NUDIX domain-containing protein [Betaproteobacteria bacterium]